ncbi:hypothetical protein [Neisseria lactamica]|nr:hypothetical protein [Neisseria lactamica]
MSNFWGAVHIALYRNVALTAIGCHDKDIDGCCGRRIIKGMVIFLTGRCNSGNIQVYFVVLFVVFGNNSPRIAGGLSQKWHKERKK